MAPVLPADERAPYELMLTGRRVDAEEAPS
jgi:hypothetical protein